MQDRVKISPEDRGGNQYWGSEHTVFIRRPWMQAPMWQHFVYSVIGAGVTVDERFMTFEKFANEFSTAQIMNDGTIYFLGRGCDESMIPLFFGSWSELIPL